MANSAGITIPLLVMCMVALMPRAISTAQPESDVFIHEHVSEMTPSANTVHKSSYTPHSPIAIYNDTQFDAQFPSRIISGFDIDAKSTGYCIIIRDCLRPFRIENNLIHGSTFDGLQINSCNDFIVSGNIIHTVTNFNIRCVTVRRAFIANNTIYSGNSIGISIGSYSFYTTVSNNTIYSILKVGLQVSGYSHTAVIQDNNISGNPGIGISLVKSHNCDISGNIISNNGIGISLTGVTSANNTITFNNFTSNAGYALSIGADAVDIRIDNNNFVSNNGAGSTYSPLHIQADDQSGKNFWNLSGTPHGNGNHWSDWTSPDNNSDGIVDLPYVLNGSAGAKDIYPLTDPVIGAGPHVNEGIITWLFLSMVVTIVLFLLPRRPRADKGRQLYKA